MDYSYMEEFKYKKKFNPGKGKRASDAASGRELTVDESEGASYIYTPEIVLHVNLALATNRPLLVRGPSGSGKSSLAKSVAYWLERPYYEQVITSRTQARDLLWYFDAVARLGDARVRQAGGEAANKASRAATSDADRKLERAQYLRPGILWWAIDKSSALRRGMPKGTKGIAAPQDPVRLPGRGGAVVLLDEIDKADPDIPNDLLEPIGSMKFRVEELDTQIELTNEKNRPLVLITTNKERELPKAFLRRCLMLDLPAPDAKRLVAIALKRWPTDDSRERKLYQDIAEIVAPPERTDVIVTPELQGSLNVGATPQPQPPISLPRPQPNNMIGSTAEYLDTVRACLDLKVKPEDDKVWPLIMKSTLLKPSETDMAR